MPPFPLLAKRFQPWLAPAYNGLPCGVDLSCGEPAALPGAGRICPGREDGVAAWSRSR